MTISKVEGSLIGIHLTLEEGTRFMEILEDCSEGDETKQN